MPAKRYVAGKVLDEASPAVQVETKVRQLLSGGRSKPGAPFTDPCPTGAREVTYKVSAIQTDVVYNERGDHDTQARMLVLDSDVAAVLAGTKKPEPLFARVNAGDCVTWELTNRLPNWFGGDAFQQLTQTNMFGQHIHLVKFDVLASDGSSNGWNYQQAAFSRRAGRLQRRDRRRDQALHRAGLPARRCRRRTARRRPRRGSPPARPSSSAGTPTTSCGPCSRTTTTSRRSTRTAASSAPSSSSPRAWTSATRGPGAFKQPVDQLPARGIPQCVTACQGNAVGTMMDVIGPGADDDFRDFGLAIADFVSLTKKGGDPRTAAGTINPPAAPEEFPDEDPGVMAINYRNAPLDLRRTKNGTAVDPAYSFSSTVFGDPQTPVLQTYAGDNVRIRLIQGSQEEQHQVLVHGQKWRDEPDDPQSPMVDAVPVGVSEAFNFEVPRLNCAVGEDCRGDYLYSGSSIDDIATGAWGILRVNGGTVPGLKPLPDNLPTRAGTVPAMSATALRADGRHHAGHPLRDGGTGPEVLRRRDAGEDHVQREGRPRPVRPGLRAGLRRGGDPGRQEPRAARAAGQRRATASRSRSPTSSRPRCSPTRAWPTATPGCPARRARAARWGCGCRCTRGCSSTTSAARTARRSASTRTPRWLPASRGPTAGTPTT